MPPRMHGHLRFRCVCFLRWLDRCVRVDASNAVKVAVWSTQLAPHHGGGVDVRDSPKGEGEGNEKECGR